MQNILKPYNLFSLIKNCIFKIMPAKKARGNNIKIIQNNKPKKDQKTQNQKNEPKFVKKSVEIKNDRYSSLELDKLTKITTNMEKTVFWSIRREPIEILPTRKPYLIHKFQKMNLRLHQILRLEGVAST